MCAIFHLKSSSKLESPQHIFFFLFREKCDTPMLALALNVTFTTSPKHPIRV